ADTTHAHGAPMRRDSLTRNSSRTGMPGEIVMNGDTTMPIPRLGFSFGPSDDLLAELERVYKDIHANPELSMQESRTAGIAAEWLGGHGYEVTTGVGGTGVIGLLRNGDGPTVLLRADMDALPIEESTGLAYASHA